MKIFGNKIKNFIKIVQDCPFLMATLSDLLSESEKLFAVNEFSFSL